VTDDMPVSRRRARLGDFFCGTFCGALTGYLLVGAVVTLATGHLLPFVPALPLPDATSGGIATLVVVRLLQAAYYAALGCVAFFGCRLGQELLRGRCRRDAWAEARRLPSIW
jgi:hypothetical protein